MTVKLTVKAYGYHPVYLLHEKSGNFDMVYLRSSNAMDVFIDTFNRKLTYKIAGGILDFQFFLGDKNPETSVRAYHDYLGGWTYQPFWSYGWHQCRWGYPNSRVLEQVVKDYTSNGLQLDVIWSDIDYMEHYSDFSIDKNNFPPEHMKRNSFLNKRRDGFPSSMQALAPFQTTNSTKKVLNTTSTLRMQIMKILEPVCGLVQPTSLTSIIQRLLNSGLKVSTLFIALFLSPESGST